MSPYRSLLLVLGLLVVESSSIPVRWCTHSRPEKRKCDRWSSVSGGAITCTQATSDDDCILQIMNDEADAVALDAGTIYIAEQCGLVPVMAEYYNKDNLKPCKTRGSHSQGEIPRDSYYAVAVVKKSQKDISLDQIQGINQMCTPGYDLNANLCNLCISDHLKILPNIQCSSSNKETFHDFSAAFRCLVEKGGVAIVRHTTAFENTDGKNPADWAKDLKADDFDLLCLDGSRASVHDFSSCNIAEIPPGLVFTRPEKKDDVVRNLINQQSLYGRNEFQRHIFQLFDSTGGQDLLFNDHTQCLIQINQKTTIKDYLGEKLYSAVSRFSQGSEKTGLLAACTLHSH